MENARAIGLITLAMAGFAVADGAIKAAAADLPASAIILIIALGGSLLFGAILLAQGLPLFTRALWHRAVIFRNLAEMGATACFITALSLVPLATVSAIIQSTPLMVALGAVVFLGETIGWRRWLAIAFGFMGVLIILRPGADGFSPAAGLAVLAAAGLAARDLASRVAPRRIGTLHLSFWGFVALVISGSAQTLLDASPIVLPSSSSAGYLTIAILFASAAVFAVTAAMRIGDVGTVSPFRYTRLIFGIAIAMIFFGERPDLTTWIGAAIVVASGLFVLFRERARPI